jgi:hypothetical protein
MYTKTTSGNYLCKNVLITVQHEAVSTGWKKMYVVGGGCKIYGQKFLTLKQAIAAISNAKTPSANQFNHNAPYNPEFLGAQPAQAGEDY